MTITHITTSLPFAGAGLPKFLRLERAYLDERDKQEISARLKDARVKAGYGEREFGELLDPPVTDRSVRNYESGRPPFRYLRQWAKITRTDYELLLHGNEPQRPASTSELAHLEELLAQVAEMVARGFEALGVEPGVLDSPPVPQQNAGGGRESTPKKRGLARR